MELIKLKFISFVYLSFNIFLTLSTKNDSTIKFTVINCDRSKKRGNKNIDTHAESLKCKEEIFSSPISNKSSIPFKVFDVKEGENVTCHCDTPVNQKRDISWKFMGEVVDEKHVDFNNANKSMTIYLPKITDSGKYICINSSASSSPNILTVCLIHVRNASLPSLSPSSGNTVYILLGCILPSMLIFFLLVSAYWASEQSKNKRKQNMRSRVILYNVISTNNPEELSSSQHQNGGKKHFSPSPY